MCGFTGHNAVQCRRKKDEKKKDIVGEIRTVAPPMQEILSKNTSTDGNARKY